MFIHTYNVLNKFSLELCILIFCHGRKHQLSENALIMKVPVISYVKIYCILFIYPTTLKVIKFYNGL